MCYLFMIDKSCGIGLIPQVTENKYWNKSND